MFSSYLAHLGLLSFFVHWASFEYISMSFHATFLLVSGQICIVEASFMVILCKIHYLKCHIFHRRYIFLHLSVLHCIIYLTKNVSKRRSKRRYFPSLNSVYYGLQQQNNFVSSSCSCRRLLGHSSLKCCSLKFEGICLSTSLLRPSYSM